MKVLERKIEAQVTDIKALVSELDTVKQLSNEMVAANQTLRTLSQDYGGEIELLRNAISGVLIGTVPIPLLVR